MTNCSPNIERSGKSGVPGEKFSFTIISLKISLGIQKYNKNTWEEGHKQLRFT